MSSHEIVLDEKRKTRIGVDEAILCEQKTPAQIQKIVRMSSEDKCSRLLTRLSEQKFSDLSQETQDLLDYSSVANVAIVGSCEVAAPVAQIAIVSAGSSDAKVVAEAEQTLRYYGQPSLVISDVGVAGIWRLMERVDEISTFPVVIAVAGMDAALPTVLSGLVGSCVIGVPTSTGYGAARNGETALSAMLVSCAPGLTVTNIDNGYGAANAALRIVHAIRGVK